MENKALLFGLGLAGAIGLFLYGQSQKEENGIIRESAGAFPSSQESGNTLFSFSDLFGASDNLNTEITPQMTKKEASSKSEASRNRDLAYKSGATGGYSTNKGIEVFTKGDKIIGGQDLNVGQSLNPEGVKSALGQSSPSTKKELNYTPANFSPVR